MKTALAKTVDPDFREGMKDAKKRLEKDGVPGPYSITLSAEDAFEAGVEHRQSVCGVRIFVVGTPAPVIVEATA